MVDRDHRTQSWLLQRKAVLDSPLPLIWVTNSADDVVASFLLKENVSYTISFSREKIVKKTQVWEATFEPSPETMKYWGKPVDQIHELVKHESMKDVYGILATVVAALKTFIVRHPGVRVYMIGFTDRQREFYPEMLQHKLDNDAIPGYKYWSKGTGDWLAPKDTPTQELISLSRKV